MLMRYGNRTFSTMLRRSQPLLQVQKPSQPMLGGMQKVSAPRKFSRDMYGSPVFEDSVLDHAARAVRLAKQEAANDKLYGGDALLSPYVLLGFALMGFGPLAYFEMKEQASPVMYRIDSSVEKPKFERHQSMCSVGEGAYHGMLKNAHGERGKPETGFALKPNRPNTLANETIPMRRMKSANSDYEPNHHMKRVASLERRGFYEKSNKEKLREDLDDNTSIY